jgi:hypothetical protein
MPGSRRHCPRKGAGIYRWLRWPLMLLAVASLLLFAAWRLTRPDILLWVGRGEVG